MNVRTYISISILTCATMLSGGANGAVFKHGGYFVAGANGLPVPEMGEVVQTRLVGFNKWGVALHKSDKGYQIEQYPGLIIKHILWEMPAEVTRARLLTPRLKVGVMYIPIEVSTAECKNKLLLYSASYGKVSHEEFGADCSQPFTDVEDYNKTQVFTQKSGSTYYRWTIGRTGVVASKVTQAQINAAADKRK